jgi:hypothetical protein
MKTSKGSCSDSRSRMTLAAARTAEPAAADVRCMAMKLPIVAFVAAVLCLGTSGAVLADGTPPPSAQGFSLPNLPSEVLNNPLVQSVIDSVSGLLQTTNGNAAHGRVTYFNRFDLQVQTAPNVYRSVHLHQGTVINPRGTTLRPGMTVDVAGLAQHDGSLNADQITAR